MTDPQNDKPCRDCKRPTQHATEICDDCRTPAGRLLTELAALGIPGEAIEEQHVNMNSSTTVGVGCLTIEVDGDGRWTIDADDSDGVTAANAIAAIVQAPGLRAERDTLAARVAELEAHNGRMVAQLLKTADACDRSSEDTASIVCDSLPGMTWRDCAAALRDLAGGAS